MSQIQRSFLPPEYWQDFQKIVLSDAERDWSDANCQLYGRDGQAQDGIDVLVTSPSRGIVGIQAKKRRLYDAKGTVKLDGGLTTAEIDAMVTEAEKFKPTLREFIIATAALPDAKLQKHVEELNTLRAKTKKFQVRVRFWDYYQGILSWNSDLQAIYYSEIVEKTLNYQPLLHYLMLVRTAFNRSAFTTRLEVEDSGDDMVQALSDTRAAITTGVLNDRKGRRIGRAPIGVDQFNEVTKANLEEAVRLLDAARQRYRQADKSRALHSNRRGVFLHGLDGKAAEREIDSLRASAVDEVNVALRAAGLEPLSNYLHPQSR
jgi:hypothetical protein